MLININKDREIINDYSSDKVIYSTNIVDSVPSDIDQFVYKYINGELVRDRLIDKTEKVSYDDFMDYMLDLDMRLIELELLGGSYDL